MVTNMKYIIDLDAFKDCLHLLRHPILKYGIIDAIYVNDVIELLDKFPKEKYGNECMDMLEKLADINEENNNDKSKNSPITAMKCCESESEHEWVELVSLSYPQTSETYCKKCGKRRDNL